MSTAPFVFFDAVGTLLYSTPDVATTYQAAAMQAGVTLPVDVIGERFRLAFESASGALATSEDAERVKWRRIVQATLPECDPIDDVFHSLWSRFGRPEQWRMFDDVAPCLEQLTDAGYRFAIASNFDQRLDDLCASIEPLQRAEFIFHSAGLGHAKPSTAFYRAIEAATGLAPCDCVMVGDDLENDLIAARKADWSALLLDRRHSQPSSSTRIGSLLPLVDWLQRHSSQ